MIWSRLKNNLCPKCNNLLQAKGIIDTMYECSKASCDFLIASERFDEIVEDLYNPKLRKHRPFPRAYDSEESRMSELNNLGHDVRSEDFSDRQAV